ncbi:flavin reductase family protein [Geminicoccus roseus]|uniref:flavin reductase family protein n=1 Tax=Geminicoccus roseus TaxID=404900 RepID=UPI00040F3B88|nr:flavin reductase family protein [Geminicoccus roseus]
MSADRTSYIDGMRRLAAGVTIVTTGSVPERFGLTATAVTSVSADPPTLLVCINRDSDSFHPILRHRRFGVNLLGPAHAELAGRFGGLFAESGEPRFAVGPWVEGAHGVPLLEDAPASFECELETVHDGASHGILVGRVLKVTTHDTGSPLLWVGGALAVPAPFQPKAG